MVAKVIWSGGERDGAAIAERAARGVSALAALGIGEGDVVAIMLRNEVAFLEAALIARQAGCYSCPINWHYKADEAGYILRDCGAKALIVHADLLSQIEGGIPAGVHVIVVEPPAELRAAFRLTGHRRGSAEAVEHVQSPFRPWEAFWRSGAATQNIMVRSAPINPSIHLCRRMAHALDVSNADQ